MQKEILYVDQRKNGKYRFTYRYHDPLTGKIKKICTTRDKNTKQAYNDALRELQSRADANDPDTMTLGDAAGLYFSEIERLLKPQTVQRNKCTVKNITEGIGADVFLDHLTAPMIKSALLDSSDSNVMYNEKLKRYKAFLNWCYSNDYIENNFWNKLRCLPDNKKERIEDKYLEPDELKQLLNSMDSCPVWYYVTYFLVLSGLRIGELIALKDNDVDDYIHITKTYELSTGGVGTTKTLESTRDVFVQTELKALISKIRRFQKEYKFAHGFRSDLFICGRNGGYFSYDAYRKYLREHSESVIHRKITPHALRHTSASIMLAQGVPLEIVSRRLGHADSDITKKIYIHITEKMKRDSEELLQQVTIL